MHPLNAGESHMDFSRRIKIEKHKTSPRARRESRAVRALFTTIRAQISKRDSPALNWGNTTLFFNISLRKLTEGNPSFDAIT